MKKLVFLSLCMGWILSCSKDEEAPKLSTDFEGKFVILHSSLAEKSPGELFFLDPTGAEQITFDDTPDSLKSDVTWVLGGDWIAYKEGVVCFCPGFGTTQLISPDGSMRRNLPDEWRGSLYIAIAPDEQHAIVSRYTYLDLFLFNANLDAQWLDSIPAHAYVSTKWSPQSDAFLFMKPSGFDGNLSIFRLSDQSITELASYTEIETFEAEFDWSSDGNQVAFIRDHVLRIVDADGTDLVQLTSDSMEVYDMAWSPVANILAYTRRMNDVDPVALVLFDVATSTETILDEVASLHSGIGNIQWSQNGSSIAFYGVGEQDGIFIIDRDGTHLRKIYDQSISGYDWYTEK